MNKDLIMRNLEGASRHMLTVTDEMREHTLMGSGRSEKDDIESFKEVVIMSSLGEIAENMGLIRAILESSRSEILSSCIEAGESPKTLTQRMILNITMKMME